MINSNLQSIIILKTEEICIEYFFDGIVERQNIGFVFSNHGNRILDGLLDGGSTLFNHEYDVISFKTTADDWFQSVPMEVFAKIEAVISHRSYRKRVAYGFSMGGFGAAVFSKLLSCNVIILLSPQYSVRDSFDTRWHSSVIDVAWQYELNRSTINKDAKYLILFDNKDIDRIHVEMFRSIINKENIVLKHIPYCDHTSIAYLQEVGLLREVLIYALDNHCFPKIDYRVNRRKSRTYLHTLTLHLYNHNKFKWAISINNMILKLEPGNIANYQTRCLILEKQIKSLINS